MYIQAAGSIILSCEPEPVLVSSRRMIVENVQAKLGRRITPSKSKSSALLYVFSYVVFLCLTLSKPLCYRKVELSVNTAVMSVVHHAVLYLSSGSFST